jgi:VWFA-related protein
MIRRFSVLLALFGIACPVFAAKQVTVAEFEQAIKQIQGKPDADAAWQIANLQLTERLSSVEFDSLESSLPGDLSRQALRGVADASDFLDPPTAELPSKPAPDFAEQRRIMSLVVAYVRGTIPQLPNLLATRNTVRFRDTPAGYKDQGKTVTRYEPLHLIGRSSVMVSYRDGREMQESETEDKAKPATLEIGLNTQGEFGPILTTVLLDAAQNKLAWSHWEQEDGQLRAVFSFSVPREKSHYQVEYCCIANSENTRTDLYRQPAAYRGEMTVDPAAGVILRLIIEAALKAGEPVANASVVVEYGPVEIGGKTYICPTRALALSRAQSETTGKDVLLSTGPMSGGGMFTGSAQSVVHSTSATQGAEQTLLNDIAFGQYHVFRSEAHIVTGDSAGSLAPQSAAELAHALPALGAPEASSAGMGNSAAPASATVGSTNAADHAPTEGASSTSPSTAVPAAAAPPAPPAEPEISVSIAKRLPDLANLPAATPDGQAEITLRTTTRLVDVTLVAYDKKGHPVADLKASDLEVYDNGHKEELRFFNPASAESAPVASQTPVKVDDESKPTVFTNRPSAENPKPSRENLSAGATILMIDAGNLAFGDLTNARGQILRFLKSLAPAERVGLYILRSRGIEVLQEPTLDHTSVATTLTHWMPNAQDLAQAQDEERRNRQDVEYVQSVGDLLYLNGSVPTGESDASLAVDPQLRSFGSNPSHDALILLPAVARHLATVVGHKTLVWISSDNVLADWSNKAPSVERGSKNIDPLALRAQETLNEAHVSIYPLDVSQLEAGGVGANTASSNAQLNPASTGPAAQAQLMALPPGLREEAQQAMQEAPRDINPGRLTAQLQANTHPIQGAFRELADATGGRALRRAGDITAELNDVVADGHAAYMLSFAPDAPADDQYHVITVKAVTRRDLTLRYRAGYVYSKEPAAFKDRLRQAIWDPRDVNEIGLSAAPATDTKSTALKLTIDATSLGLTEKTDRWTDRLDVFVALRDQSGLHARVLGHSVDLRLLPGTYQQILKDGIPFEQPIDAKAAFDSARFLVVDENSGRIGSVTVPASAFEPGS